VSKPKRAPENPIITPAMVPPSRSDMKVVGVFNPAAIRQRDDTVLLLRVAEAPVSVRANEVAAPVFDAATGDIQVKRWPRDTKGLDLSDSRLINVAGRVYLSSISHFRIARATDGVRFQIAATPAMAPATPDEAYGIEDPRISEIDGTYWINYTAVSARGIATALASTKDFITFERHGVIFPPDNRDVTIFPEKIGGEFAALHRPMPSGIGLARPAIWAARSSDMLSWGRHEIVAEPRDGRWDDAKIGGGAVPFRVRVWGRDAWLAIYHGVSSSPLEYSLGAIALDIQDPSRLIGRSREPIMRPETSYEREGFFGGVVFTCGAVVDGDQVRVYYGAADGVTAVADLSLEAILAGLEAP
jgi:beta-1,2-mannobiose phosphorylase / 1,2-beta-oligomannan phosphorylase